ncbi:MAG: FlxA-like family protein [Candidatus Binatia bacterium]
MRSTQLMRHCVSLALISSLCVNLPASANDAPEIETLKRQIKQLQQTVEELQNALQNVQQDATAREQRIQRQLQALPSQVAPSPLDQAVQAVEARESHSPVRVDPPQGSRGQQRWIDVSFIPLFFAGSSSRREDGLRTLQAGGHDPAKRGFTLAQGELGLAGAVDPYFRAQAYLTAAIDPVEGETIWELEEAFLTTQALPYGLQLEVGHFFTEFGQINPRHPHQWDWLDQPVINSRLFGPDGMRAPGFRTSLQLPTPWFSEFHVGMQNANGETMTSFLGKRHAHGAEEEEDGHAHEAEGDDDHAEEGPFRGDAIGNRPLIERDVRALKDFTYLTRWNNFWEITPSLSTLIGVSGLYGPNATGRNGDTWIYGLDMKWRWRPTTHFRGWPFVLWQTEIMRRNYHADRFTVVHDDDPTEVDTLPGRTLHDWGLYSQLLYGFRYGWAAGVRYEYAGGSGQSVGGGKNDPFRSERHRVSPLLAWHPSEFTRIRLQYNFDHANHLRNNQTAHSVWLGLEWLYGTHAPHEY